MDTNFCHRLKKAYRIEYGKVKPCCFFIGGADVENPEEVKLQYERLSKVDDWIPECNVCKRREDAGIISPRQKTHTNETFAQAENKIISLQIQFDYTCNAACLICGPWASTTWGKYLSNIDQNSPKVIRLNQEEQTYAAADMVATLEKIVNFSDLEKIEFLGGEPLMTNVHNTFLNRIPDPSSVEICYTTNLSCMPSEEILNTWRKFKQVKIMGSIDGIGDHHHYLRWPMQWTTLENNIKRILSQPGINYQFIGSYTLTPFSAYYHDRCENWAKEFFDGTAVDHTAIFSTPWTDRGGKMDISATPQTLIDEIKHKYGEDHIISKIMEPHNPIKYTEFMDYINYHDGHRKLNWREVFPEIQHHFK